MGKTILATDMVSIGLLLLNGNIDITLEKLFSVAEEYMEVNNREFGVSAGDYRASVISLGFIESQLPGLSDLDKFNQIAFREIIPFILLYHEVYFNDEGEHWLNRVRYDDSDLTRFLRLDRKSYEAKMRTHKAMIQFFKKSKNKLISPDLVNEFMVTHGITTRILEDCSQTVSNIITG